MVSPYSIEGNMGPLGIGPQGGGMGRGQGNWLADALTWQVPGTQSIPRLPARNIPRIGGHIDTAGRWLIPGVETQRMAEQGASPGALGGSLAMDALPVGMVAGKVGRTLRGVLPSGLSNIIKYPAQQASRAGDWMMNRPRLIPLRFDELPTKPGMEQTFNKYAKLLPNNQLGPREIPPKYLTDPITTNPTTPYVPSRNWATGREEPGISTFQGLKFPRGGIFPARTATRGMLIPSADLEMLYDVNDLHTNKLLFDVDADFIPGVHGSDYEAVLDPASVRGVTDITGRLRKPGGENPSIEELSNWFSKYTDTGQLINPPWHLRPEGIPMSIPTSAFAAAIPAARAGQISQE